MKTDPILYVGKLEHWLTEFIHEHGFYLFMVFAWACFAAIAWLLFRKRKSPPPEPTSARTRAIVGIMLASVLERTTEIGLRRAIGARRLDIRLQFIAEALGLSLAGGLVGIGLGYAISRLVAAYSGWSTIITPESIALSFGVSSVVGLVFGIYPAVQASNLDPIECLRYE